MGDLRVCPPRPKGLVSTEDRPCPTSFVSLSPLPVSNDSNPDPSSIAVQTWETAEQTTHQILCAIQPNSATENKRMEIVEYVRGLIIGSFGYEVSPYGSVPLKTYLPDGDIDLTAICVPTVEDALASNVYAVLSGEERNEAAHYVVKEVHCIDAEVKLVKCLVQNIVVDISFNQLGGLSTLCFLEQVDRLVGKDHLFKRSIILIKAWCFYESRILGAHHGLISTYALETLVLYIFNRFHSSINGPLVVLYRFLDYFGKFDWENYCISLNGPVCISSQPDVVADIPENGRDGLLLSEEFLRECVVMFSVPSRMIETNPQAFSLKHLNIVDPLKENNNLGRSVNKGNFYRICSAFKYGARKLGQILLLPRERMADELNKFFANTLNRRIIHNNLTDGLNPALASGARGSDHLLSSSHSDTSSEDSMYSKSSVADLSDHKILGFRNEPARCSLKVVPYHQPVGELNCPADRNAVSGYQLAEDAEEAVTSGFLPMRSRNNPSDCLPLSCDLGSSLPGNSHLQVRVAPHSYFSGFVRDNVGNSNGLALYNPAANISENSFPSLRERNFAGVSGSSESLKSLLDFRGDYDSHFGSVIYGQYCLLYDASPPISTPLFPPPLQNKNTWETIPQSLQLKQKFYPQMNTNGVFEPLFYPVNPPIPSNATFCSEENKKPRGTGTYFPSTNYRSNRGRPSSGRGRGQVGGRQSHLLRNTCNSGLARAPRQVSYELSQEEYPVLGRGKSRSLDSHQPRTSMWGSSNASGFSCPAERLESGSQGFHPRGIPLPGRCAEPDLGTLHNRGSASSLQAPAVQSPKPVLKSNQERAVEQSYHLTNEVDFPPLTL